MTAVPLFYLREGVRRAVAARELNFAVLPAWLVIAGRPDRLTFVSPQQLQSPRGHISASDPRYLKVLQGFSTPAGRARMPEIVIEPLGIKTQSGSIPLKQVRLDP